MRATKRLFTAAIAALSLSVSYIVVFAAPASADLPYCMGTYHIQATNGQYVSNREDNGGLLQPIIPGDRLGTWERFRLFRHTMSPNGPRRYAIRGSDDYWVHPSWADGLLRAEITSTPGGLSHEMTFTWSGSNPPNGTFQPMFSVWSGMYVGNEGPYLTAYRSSPGSGDRFKWIKLNSSCLHGS